MTSQALEMMADYNTKVMLTMRAFGDLNVATAEFFVSKQVALSNSMMETAIQSGKEISSVKTPAEAVEASSKLMKSLTETMKGFVKESSENAVSTRDELKVVINDAVKLNSEYAEKTFDTSVDTIKKAANKAA